MNALDNQGRRWNPPIAPAGEAGAERFVGRPAVVTGRITTPLTGPAPVAPAAATTAAAAAPSPTPRRSARRKSGPSGLLLSGLLGLGLALGGIGGGAASLLVSQSARTAAPAAVAPVASINPSGVTNTSTSLIHDLYNKVANSVVTVQVQTGNGGPFGAGGEGSGIVIDGGHVLTNYHVVDGASVIHVLLADSTSVTATVAGSAAQDDLALLAVNLPADKVTPAVLGDSDSAQVGDEVVAIGSPFGLDHTVTAGIISYLNRAWSDGSGPVENMIQTDTPINPGNSGGALFNLQGEVIGITTAIQSPVRGSVGVGFAIPINHAKSLLPQLTQGATVQRVWLGIQGAALDAQTAAQLQVPVTQGVLVVDVVANSPAAQAGLQGADPTQDSSQVGDIITAIDGKPVAAVSDISSYLSSKQVGDTIALSVWRAGQTLPVKVTLAAWPETTTP